MVELCVVVWLSRCTLSRPTLFHIGAEIVVTSKRMEETKRKKTPILVYLLDGSALRALAEARQIIPVRVARKCHVDGWRLVSLELCQMLSLLGCEDYDNVRGGRVNMTMATDTEGCAVFS